MVCKNNDRVYFEGVKNFYFDTFLVLSKKLYNFYNNFGFVKTVNISDDLNSEYDYGSKECLLLNKNTFAIVDKELNSFYTGDFIKVLNNNVFRKESNFGVSVSYDDFKVSDSFVFRCFKKASDGFFLVFSRATQSFFVFL